MADLRGESNRARIEVDPGQLEAMLTNTVDAGARAPQSPPPAFDPAMLEESSIPESAEKPMVEGLREHLKRYSAHQAAQNTIERLQDAAWLEAWDKALAVTAGQGVMFYGSELGTLALRALAHGASRVVIVEPSPLDSRVAAGIVQKNRLIAWHDANACGLSSLTDDQKRASFESFNANIDILPADSSAIDCTGIQWLVIPNIDHSLLGTGIVGAVNACRSRGLSAEARVLPGKATLFVMGVQWEYVDTPFNLDPLADVRWSFYPGELDHRGWKALTTPVEAAVIDFGDFVETERELRLPAHAAGKVDALVYWFELDLGGVRISSSTQGGLRCLRPALQYLDGQHVEPGDELVVDACLRRSRLHLRTRPAASKPRISFLPGWHVPMLLDGPRNSAYQAALNRMATQQPLHTVLDIGSGSSLLSMMAARCGARRVYGCEVNAELSRIGGEIVRVNGLGETVKVLNKDCRKLTVPGDLPERAELAVFEMFDCSLIGEGVLHFLEYARKHLLTEAARYIPRAARIRGMLVEHRFERLWDLDIALLNPYRYTPSFINVDSREVGIRALSEPFEVCSFDFATATPAPQSHEVAPVAIADGIVSAVVFWFDVQMDEQTWLSNAPQSGVGLHWKQALQFLPEARVSQGTAMPLIARHDGSHLFFGWAENALPRAAFLALPRFDPRRRQQASELEAQTGQLIEHCFADVAERDKVAVLAARFAIDPGAQGIDPKVAQRFASLFYSA